jgi:TP901 family phage tail tape measure protein
MTDLIKAGFDASDFVKGSKQIQDALKAIDTANRAYVRAQLSADLSLQKSAAKVVGTIITGHNRQVESATRAAARLARIEAQRVKTVEAEAKREADAVARAAARSARERERWATAGSAAQIRATGLQISANRQLELSLSAVDARAQKFRATSQSLAAQMRANAQATLAGSAQIRAQADLKNLQAQPVAQTPSLNLPINPKNLAKSVVYNASNRAFFAATGAIGAGIADAIEFEQAISRIQTLSSDTASTFQDWSKSITELSGRLGFERINVAKAAYEALSAQIGESRNQIIDFAEEAARFAQITGTDTGTAVKTLSDTINALGKTAGDTEEIASLLFKAIDLGNISANDLANTFGKTLVPAYQLGLSLQDVLASLRQLTLNGVKTADAQTQLYNLFNKLVRPTEELKRKYKEWGAATGEALIASKSWLGVLELLNNELLRGDEIIAKEFSDIRAIRGVIGQVGPYFESFRRGYIELGNAATDYSEKVKIAFDSAGKRTQQAGQQVKNLFGELGQSILILADNAIEGWKIIFGGGPEAAAARRQAESDRKREIANITAELNDRATKVKEISAKINRDILLAFDAVKVRQNEIIANTSAVITASGSSIQAVVASTVDAIEAQVSAANLEISGLFGKSKEYIDVVNEINSAIRSDELAAIIKAGPAAIKAEIGRLTKAGNVTSLKEAISLTKELDEDRFSILIRIRELAKKLAEEERRVAEARKQQLDTENQSRLNNIEAIKSAMQELVSLLQGLDTASSEVLKRRADEYVSAVQRLRTLGVEVGAQQVIGGAALADLAGATSQQEGATARQEGLKARLSELEQKLEVARRDFKIASEARIAAQSTLKGIQPSGLAAPATGINYLVEDILGFSPPENVLKARAKYTQDIGNAATTVKKAIQAEQQAKEILNTLELQYRDVVEATQIEVELLGNAATALGQARQQISGIASDLSALKAVTSQPAIARATGGYVDSVNARLTPGEYIMNRMATARFYPAIHNMNTKAASSATTNVGDINISLTSSGSEGYDAVKLGKLLRRGIRQGTVKLP